VRQWERIVRRQQDFRTHMRSQTVVATSAPAVLAAPRATAPEKDDAKERTRQTGFRRPVRGTLCYPKNLKRTACFQPLSPAGEPRPFRARHAPSRGENIAFRS
jgi:hypothetical protein